MIGASDWASRSRRTPPLRSNCRGTTPPKIAIDEVPLADGEGVESIEKFNGGTLVTLGGGDCEFEVPGCDGQ
jgi:hypothetical protein